MGTKFSAPPLGLARSRTPASQLWLLLIIITAFLGPGWKDTTSMLN